MGLKEQVVKDIIRECIEPLLKLKKGFEKQENRADEIAENLPPEKYPSVSAVIAFVKNKIEVFSEAVGKVYLKATDFEDYKTDASKTYATKTDVEDFEKNVAETYAMKTDVEDFENNVADTYATKTDVEDFEKNVAETYATKTDVEDFENNVAETYATKTDVENLKTDTEVTATATGKAISIFSAGAPIPQLILRGETTQDGTPTPDNPIELKSVGDSGSFATTIDTKNLIDLSNFVTQTKNGVTFTNNSDGSITVNGTATAKASINLLTLSNFDGGDYILSGCKSGDRSVLYASYFDENFNWITENWCTSGDAYLLKGEYGRIIIAIFVNAGETCNNTTIYPMLRHKSYNNAFEKGNKQVLTMPYTLRSVGDIKDEVDFARGVLIQRIYAVDLGTLNWNMPYTSIFNGTYFSHEAVGSRYNDDIARAFCTHYKAGSVSGSGTGVFGGGDKIFSLPVGTAVKHISVKDTNYTDATSFKASLSGVYLVYPLATPIEIPLTEQELNAYRHLMTNKGTTTILSECEDTEITYYVNKPNAQAIGNIHSQVNEDYFKLQQAIISLGGN